MDHTINTKDLDHGLVQQEINLKIAKMNHVELANFCILNGINFEAVTYYKRRTPKSDAMKAAAEEAGLPVVDFALDMRGTCAVNAGLELQRQFMVARTPEELEPIPFPNLYDGMEEMEACSDDVQMILNAPTKEQLDDMHLGMQQAREMGDNMRLYGCIDNPFDERNKALGI